MHISNTPLRGLRLPAVAERLQCSKSQVWRLSAIGALKSPVKVSPRITIWLESDIDEYLSERAQSHRTYPTEA